MDAGDADRCAVRPRGGALRRAFCKGDRDSESPANTDYGGLPARYLISPKTNNSFVLVNRLLTAKADVYWVKAGERIEGQDMGTGAIWVPPSAPALPMFQKVARELGSPYTP